MPIRGALIAKGADGVVDLHDELGEDQLFYGEPPRRVTEARHYGRSGRLVEVGDLVTAMQTLDDRVPGRGAPTTCTSGTATARCSTLS